MEIEYKVLGHENEEQQVARDINALAHDIGAWARGKGFWNVPKALQDLAQQNSDVHSFVTLLRKSQKGYLMMSELGEHCESLRARTVPAADECPGGNECEELADAVIRILDYCGEYQLPIGEAIVFKMAKNQKRPYQHGKKF